MAQLPDCVQMPQQGSSRAQSHSGHEVFVLARAPAAVEVDDSDSVHGRGVVGYRGSVQQLNALRAMSGPETVEVNLRKDRRSVRDARSG